MEVAYVKGKWLAAADACIGINERGFRYGDGVFETIRAQAGTPLFLSEHLARLQAGLVALRMPTPSENIAAICQELLLQNTAQDGVIRVSVSRGAGGRGYMPQPPQPPTVVVELLPLPEASRKPLTLWLADIRKPSLKSLPVQHKLMQGLNSTLARMEAVDQGCDEALMLTVEEHVCEASAANIFWVDEEGVLHTPAPACGALAGIGRQIMLQEWQGEKAEGQYPLEALEKAQAVFLTNAVQGVMPIGHLNPQGWSWQPNRFTRVADEIWQKAVLRQLSKDV